MNSFTETLLGWYDANGRDLPWRRTRDPYAIWLSEIILQQTRIAQGQAYWERFLAAFPDVQRLAAASEDEVLRLWQGLGYYSRARNLHAAAKQIVALGRFPDDIGGIRTLKGVGDYTAAAIGSIAFGLPAAVVDGNVYRVLARHFGIGTPVGSTAAKKEFTAPGAVAAAAGPAGRLQPGAEGFRRARVHARHTGLPALSARRQLRRPRFRTGRHPAGQSPRGSRTDPPVQLCLCPVPRPHGHPPPRSGRHLARPVRAVGL